MTVRSSTFGVIYALRGHRAFTSTGGPSLTVLDTNSFEASILQEVSLVNTPVVSLRELLLCLVARLYGTARSSNWS